MLRSSLLIVLFAIAMLPAGKAVYWMAKAELAQILIKRAWEKGEPDAPPWPWADTRPVARLQIDSHEIDALVLGGGNDHALAFGPGLTNASVAPGLPGITLIGAHRDTQFVALQHLKPGTDIRLQGKDRIWHNYVVSDIQIIDDAKLRLRNTATEPTLVLTTCYPFDPLVMNSSRRLLVTALWTKSSESDHHSIAAKQKFGGTTTATATNF